MNYALETGIINEQDIRAKYEMRQRENYLKEHAKKHSIWFSESTKCWTATLPDETKAQGRRIIKRKNRKELEDVIVQYYRTLEDKPTVEEIFYRWIDRRLHQYDDFERQTANKYVNDFKRYIAPTAFSKKYVKDLTEFEVVDYIRRFSVDRSINPKMRANFMILITGIMQYAREMGYSKISMKAIKEDYDIRSHKRNKRKLIPGEDVFLDDEVTLLKDYINCHTDDIVLLGLLLVIHTGLRVGELAALKWTDFDTEQHVLTVTRTEIKYQDDDGHTVVEVRESTKGAVGWRMVVFSDEVIRILDLIRDLNPFGEYLFMINGKRINANAWTKKLPRLCGKLGIGEKAEGTDRVNGKSIHKLRKTYISKLIDAHVDPILMTMQAGHVDMGTSYTYYYRNTRSIRQTVDKLMPALETL